MGPDHPPGPAHAGVMGRARRSQLGNVHLGSGVISSSDIKLTEEGQKFIMKMFMECLGKRKPNANNENNFEM